MILEPETLRDGDALTKEEGFLLMALVHATKPKLIVETGTHKGVSAAYMAEGLRLNGFGHLHTYDPFDWGARGNLEPLRDWVTYHQEKGKDAVVEGEIDFLFIDGYHQKEAVLEEFTRFLPQLSEHAMVVWHDCWDAEYSKLAPGEIAAADVNGAIRELEKGLQGFKTTWIPTKNAMRIWEKSGK